jgi:hypothetical protein
MMKFWVYGERKENSVRLRQWVQGYQGCKYVPVGGLYIWGRQQGLNNSSHHMHMSPPVPPSSRHLAAWLGVISMDSCVKK